MKSHNFGILLDSGKTNKSNEASLLSVLLTGSAGVALNGFEGDSFFKVRLLHM